MDNKLREQLLTTLKLSIAFSAFLAYTGLAISTTSVIPENAIVLLDDKARTYTGPPCVQELGSLRIATVAEAYQLGYEPEPECRDQGGFTQEARSLTGLLLERIGLLGPLPRRWNADGTWNW